MPARIPPERIQQPKRRLRDLNVGEDCYVSFTAMRVDPAGFGFLDPDEKMETPGFMAINVRRDSVGYHVTVQQRRGMPTFTFLPKRDLSLLSEKWLPVESFEEVQADSAS